MTRFAIYIQNSRGSHVSGYLGRDGRVTSWANGARLYRELQAATAGIVELGLENTASVRAGRKTAYVVEITGCEAAS